MNDVSGLNLLTIVCFYYILRVNPRYGFYHLLIGAVTDSGIYIPLSVVL